MNNQDKQHYLEENDLRAEIIKVQKVERLKALLEKEELSDEEKAYKASLEAEGIDPKYSRQRFGEMCLLLINRILTQPKYSGYTYKDSFISTALLHIFKYAIKNFDDTKISKISGEKIKAFAYLTGIINNAILQVINTEKEEQMMLSEYFVEHTETGIRQHINELTVQDEEDETIIYDVEIRPVFLDNGIWYKALNINDKEEYAGMLDEDKLYYYIGDEVFEFTTLLDVVNKHYAKSMFIIYPKNYNLKEKEFKEITKKEFDALNIVKFKGKYTPSFPKKAKKTKVNELDGWL